MNGLIGVVAQPLVDLANEVVGEVLLSSQVRVENPAMENSMMRNNVNSNPAQVQLSPVLKRTFAH